MRSGATAVAGLMLALLAIAPAAAGAATRWAEPGGDGPAATCPEANPCEIQDAVEDFTANSGDTVLLKAGSYVLGADSLIFFDDLTIRPAPGAGRPTLTSNGAGAIQMSDGTLQDLRVQAFDAGGIESVISAQSSAVLDRLVVEGFGATPAAITAGDGSLVRSSVVTNSDAIAVRGAGSGVTVQNSTLLAIEETGVGFDANTSWGPNQTSTIVNSIVSGDTADIVADDHHLETQDIEVVVRHSNFDLAVETGLGDAVIMEGPGNQSEQALLVDRPGRDLRQLPGSPTIGAGSSSPATGVGLGSFDFELSPRVQGAVDIGADEATDPNGLLRLPRGRIKAKRALRIRAACPPADCEVTVTGRLRLPGRDPKTSMDVEELEQGVIERLVLRIGRRKLARLRNALARARLIVTVHAEDELGFERDLVRRYRFKRRRR